MNLQFSDNKRYQYFQYNNKNIICGFSTRFNGMSEREYFSLNFGLHTNDNKNNVIKNRKLFAQDFNVQPENIIFMNQTHSDNIRYISDIKNKKDNGFYNQENALSDTDAVYTDNKNLMLCVLTADCCPVLIYFSDIKVVAAVHSGWKGAVKKIVNKTVLDVKQKFKNMQFHNIKIFIGPNICGKCYEVDKKFVDNINSEYSEFKKFLYKSDNTYFFDIKKSIIINLYKIGVKKNNIFDSKICNYENFDTYYSYRRNKNTGRIINFIKLNNST
jgi:hypothetical protein